MDNKATKFSKLYSYLFVSVFIFLGGLAAILGGLYGIVKTIASRPVDVFLELTILAIPTIIFLFAYIVFALRTKKNHPKAAIRAISYVLFTLAIAYCIYGFSISVITYLKKGASMGINEYHTYTIYYLAGNITLLFIIGIIQALSMDKEEDWMERKKRLEAHSAESKAL